MKTRHALLAAVTSLVFLSVTARADAPADQYDSFGKTTARIRDRYTLLRWDRFDVPLRNNTTLDDDEKFCQSRTAALGGPGRLPTVKELLTLVDETPHDEVTSGTGVVEPRAIDRNAFPSTPVDHPYVTTAGATGAWAIDFHSGAVTVGTVPQPHYVRCVLAE